MNKVSIPLLMLSTLALLSACGGGGSSSQTTPNPTAVPTAEPTPTLEPTPTPEPSPEPTATPTPEPGPTSEPMLVEAESGSLTGLTVANSQSGYSGSGYVTGFADGDERLALSFTLAESGSYSIVIGYRTIGGQKGFDYTLDAASGSAMFADSATFSEYPLGTFSLDAGEHSFTLGGGWNWYEIDYIAISAASTDRCITEGQTYPLCETDTGSWGVENGELCLSASFCPGMRSSQSAMAEDLQNPNADATAQGVYDYLRSVWGSKTLSGQQDLTWKDSTDMYQRVFNDTGEYPALMGYDFMNYTPNTGGSGLQQTEEAIAHWARGGLVTFAWHWRSPLADDNAAFYTSQSDLEIPVNNYLLDTSGSVFEDLAQQIDIVAEQLQVLENNGVTVIFRPLHEAAGGWFWWGRSRSDDVPPAYAQVLLWQYLYNDLVNTRGLNNLIWMWNGQSALWYPGDDYVDIVSYDLYDNNNPQNYSARADTFAQTAGFPLQEKMVAASENGSIPHPDAMAANNAQWLFFMTWNDGDSAEGVTDSNNFWTGEYYNTNAHKQQVYSHENIVNLEDLPGSW